MDIKQQPYLLGAPTFTEGVHNVHINAAVTLNVKYFALKKGNLWSEQALLKPLVFKLNKTCVVN